MRFRTGYFVIFFILFSCSEKNQVYTPVGVLKEKDMLVSKNRSKSLNRMERELITKWIEEQGQKFYPTKLNYWVSVENFEQRIKKEDGQRISYQYELYDFEMTPLYKTPKIYQNVVLGKFKDLSAVEDALRYLQDNEEVVLLVPSVLAYGTYGDGQEISYDMPLIIRLKKLK